MAISSHKRRKIADFDPVRDGKTITQFCKEEQISRQTFHNVKNRMAKRSWVDTLRDSGTLKDRQGRLVRSALSLLRAAKPWGLNGEMLKPPKPRPKRAKPTRKNYG